ncbi:MAG: monooxygenase FAD-binding protein [Marmoricola sp.]|nr:monooxygenase FAD-binding protein [Marmoricola sp.]
MDAHGTVLETFRAVEHDGDCCISEIDVLRGDFSQLLYDDTSDDLEVFGPRERLRVRASARSYFASLSSTMAS